MQVIPAAGGGIVALGKAALATPDFPMRIPVAQELAGFVHAILGLIAYIKPAILLPGGPEKRGAALFR